MQPTNAADTRAAHTRIRPRPSCGIVGYPAAWAKLERVESDAQLAVLDRLVRGCGFSGPAALGWFTGCLLWEAGLRDYPTAPRSLKPAEVKLIEERAHANMGPLSLTDAQRALFPKLRAADPKLRQLGKAPRLGPPDNEWGTR